MDQYEIVGGKKLRGRLRVSGSKNAALPCLFATLLTDQKCVLTRVPDLADITTSVRLLKTLGKKVQVKGEKVTVEKSRSLTGTAPYELVRRMRASALVLGPLLARKKKAWVSLPGGCAIGARPLNYHLDGFERMRVKIDIREGYVNAATRGLKGALIPLPYPSVGATENLMMGAVLAKGTTIIQNAAREPEVIDLGEMLQKMGAHITGLGTSEIQIEGVPTLHGVEHDVIPDRIEAGTFVIATAVTKGDVTFDRINLKHLGSVVSFLKAAGLKFEMLGPEKVRVRCGKKIKPTSVETDVYPGFPTDMQAQWIALMSVTPGRSQIRETVFENRFLHVQELQRFGADIQLNGRTAFVKGVKQLSGCTVMVSDLRAGAALVLAGLAAKGKSTILRIYHLDRGYENLEKKLRALGASIKRVKSK